MRYFFKTAPLPKSVFRLLQQIAGDERVTQREVVIAGVFALTLLTPEQRATVWREALAYRKEREADADPDV